MSNPALEPLAPAEVLALLQLRGADYLHLADLLESPADAAAADALADTKARLSEHPGAKIFGGQLESAERVFSKR